MNVKPLTEEEIATLSANLYYPQEYSLYHALLETIRQRTEAAEYSTQCWEIASQKWAEALRQRDEAVALLSDYRYLVCSQQARDRIEAFLERHNES